MFVCMYVCMYICVVFTRCSKLLDSSVNNAFVTLDGVNFVHVSDNKIVSLSSTIPAFQSAVCMHPFSTFSYISLYYF